MAIQTKRRLSQDSDADTVALSPWLEKLFPQTFSGLTTLLKSCGVPCELLPETADLWCRDYMPVQLAVDRFVCYTYRPDYLLKKRSDRRFITDPRRVCNALGLQTLQTDFIIDGGNIVKTGSRIIMTEKVFAENPQHSRRKLHQELEKLFECEICFIPWDRAEPYGHADGIVKAISDDTVLMTNYTDFDRSFAAKIKRALSNCFHVETLRYDYDVFDERSWAYINFLTVGNLIVLPRLNTSFDEQALKQIGDFYPAFRIEQLDAAQPLAAGGGLNCITWSRRRSYSSSS